MGKLIMHEEARKADLFTCTDNDEELVEFATKSPVVFFSYQWLAWSYPVPTDARGRHGVV